MYAASTEGFDLMFFLADRPEGEEWNVEEGVGIDIDLNVYFWPRSDEGAEHVLCRSIDNPGHYKLYKSHHEIDRDKFTPTGKGFGGVFAKETWERFSKSLLAELATPGMCEEDPPGAFEEALRDPGDLLSMARVIVLDSGPLGQACGNPGTPRFAAITEWRIMAQFNGVILIIPEIADFEVRRELIRKGATASLGRLDALCLKHAYVPITTTVMRKAAELWAEARGRGLPTAGGGALDGDAILAAQALGCVGLGDDLTVATSNVLHLSRFPLDARAWEEFVPTS